MNYDFGKEFYVDISNSKTQNKCVYSGNNYRISVITNNLIRFEYNALGKFNDYPTLFARNRNFATPSVKVKEDDKYINISNNIFTLEYKKNTNFIGTKLNPTSNLKVKINDKEWYFNFSDARNIKSSGYSLDSNEKFINSLYNLDGFSSVDDSNTPILSSYGSLLPSNNQSIDTYLFIYNDDFGICLKDYFLLTSSPNLIPRYALGLWWNKNEYYNEKDISLIIDKFKDNNIPLSVFLLGKKQLAKYENTNVSFSIDKQFIPNYVSLCESLNKNNVKVGLTISTNGILSSSEEGYNEFLKLYGRKEDNLELNPFDNKVQDSFLKAIINPLVDSGTSFFYIDNKSNDRIMNTSMNYYIYNTFNKYKDKRNFMLSRNNMIASHKYGALYSGETLGSYKTLKLLPYFNSSASNFGLSFWAHDIGGYSGGTESAELFIRYVQFGVFSPIMLFSTDKGKYYKRMPWMWDAKTNKIVSDYIKLRYRLLPYIYNECYRYMSIGSPLIQPLYYKYKDIIDEKDYTNEYHFGSSILISPITNKKDTLMNRVVHKLYLPKGVWYDFMSGKKYSGGRYTIFYKDEEYPIFVPSGAIIPLNKLDTNNINFIGVPSTLELNIFPGKSNVYNLYEDDGESNMYKDGMYFITTIEYHYKENDFSVEIKPKEGNQNVLPKERKYIVNFRNTKYTKDVQVFENEKLINCNYYTNNNDFIVEFACKSDSKILVFCKGKDIEINAVHVISDELQSIISDLEIETSLKEKIDDIVFSNASFNSKKIKIRKLNKDGLDMAVVKMFSKLLEYMNNL